MTARPGRRGTLDPGGNVRAGSIASAIVTFLAAGGLLVAGCRKPVDFPTGSDSKLAASLGAAAAYDPDHDGRADYFLYADPAGRIDRIAYDLSGDEKPDQVIPLDAIPFGQCRHLVLILDGFAYELVRQYYDAGGLRMFWPPSRVVAPYPTMTDVCIQDIIGGVPCRAFEALYFDRRGNRLVGGSGDYLAGKNEPYNKLLQYRADTLWDAIGYVDPWAVFGKEINDVKRLFDGGQGRQVMAYFVSSAGVGTRMGGDGQKKCLQRVEQLVNQIVCETRGLTKVTLTSDHGHSYTPGKRVDFDGYLRRKGWRPAKSLQKPRDVVQIAFGLVTFAAFATRRPAALAEDLVGCDGVELASFAEGGSVVVLGRNGQRARITRKNNAYGYHSTGGDPLELKGILAGLTPDEAGLYDADALLAATVSHQYPAPLQRLWRAHFGLVMNSPDVIVSLADDAFAGSASFAGTVSIASTHGSLNYTNSVTFIMSTIGPMPPYMRSRDIPAQMKSLTGTDWPGGQ